MTPEQFRRAQELYERLEGVPADRRDAELAALCPDDAELRERVLEMIDVPAGAELRLDARIRALLQPGTGTLVGPYRLMRPLGEGGMGAVWLARQERPVARDVALKLIRPGLGTSRLLARFGAEQRASSRMQHPAIARLYDAGVSGQGLPYFAMEYVDGAPITAFCDRERLGVRARLELFVLVCQGVQHAHQKAVLHRDLKPSNVLVQLEDGRPVPKIIDFGIAKAIEPDPATEAEEAVTEFGSPVGTPAYMSPERLLGDPADTRGDVYSLGMLLCELLAGALPFAPGSDRERIRRELAAGRVARPSDLLQRSATAAEVAARRGTEPARLAAELRRDLDWIVLQATSADPARRYPSASALAEDVANYLDGRPVRARPPSLAYVAARLVRRHRVAVGIAALLATVVTLGVVGTAIGLLRAREAESAARREAQVAEQSLQFLVGMFERVDPLAGLGPNVTTRRLLEVGARHLEATPPEDAAVLARLKQAIGRAYWTLSEHALAERLLTEALALQSARQGADHPDTLRTKRYLAELYWARGPLDLAERHAREAFEGAARVLGPANRDTLDAQSVLVTVLARRARYDEALPLASALVARRRAVHGDAAPETAAALYELAALRARTGDPTTAERLQRESFEIRRRLFGPMHLQTLQSEMALADLAVERGDYASAEPVYRRVRAEVERQWGTSAKASYRLREKIGDVLYRQRRWAEARVELEAALDGYRRLLQPDHPDVLTVTSRLGQTLAALGRLREAAPLLRTACTARRAQFGDVHAGTRESCAALAAVGAGAP
jgi:serine/threonine protein kinase